MQAGVCSAPIRAEIEAVLQHCGMMMNRVSAHYGQGSIAYEETILGLGDGDALIRHLERLMNP
jgi:hypothetical protein